MADITRDNTGAQTDSDGAAESDHSPPNGVTALSERFSRRPGFVRWAAALAVALAALIICLIVWGPNMDFPSEVPQEEDGVSEPKQISRIISDEIKEATSWLVRNWGSMFDGIDKAITITMVNLEDALRWIPWPATFIAVVAMAMIMAGWRLALFRTAELGVHRPDEPLGQLR